MNNIKSVFIYIGFPLLAGLAGYALASWNLSRQIEDAEAIGLLAEITTNVKTIESLNHEKTSDAKEIQQKILKLRLYEFDLIMQKRKVPPDTEKLISTANLLVN